MSIPQVDPQVEQDAVEALGVIIKSPKARGVLDATLGLIGATLTGATSAAGALVVTGHTALIPSWMPVALVIGYAVFAPISSIVHGIAKANVK